MKLGAYIDQDVLIVQGLFSGILLVDLYLLFIVVVQGPSYGRLLCLSFKCLYVGSCYTKSLTMEEGLLQRPCFGNLLQLRGIRVLVRS